MKNLAVALFALLICFSTLHAQESESPMESEHLLTPITAPSDSGIFARINALPESIRSSEPYAREIAEMIRMCGPSGTFDKDLWIHNFEIEQNKLLNQVSLKAASPLAQTWVNIGPSGAGVLSAGCTGGLVVDPKNSSVVWAASSGGGVWKSTDGGDHWMPLTDYVIPHNQTSSIAIDPVNTNTVYVGTGTGLGDEYSLGGYGVYKTEDGGLTWTHLSKSSQTEVLKVFVDPAKPDIVLASFNNGLVQRSSDRGTNWATVSSGGPCWDFAGTPDGSKLYLYRPNAVYSSTDDGAHWKSVTGKFPTNNMSRGQIQVPAAAPQNVFVLATGQGGDSVYLFKSTDQGQSWVSLDPPTDLFTLPGTTFSAQGNYDLSFAVTPGSNVHDTMFVGGVAAYYNASDGLGWIPYSHYGQSVSIHVDHHSLAVDPSNSSTVYDGNDGGVFKSTDGGFTWAPAQGDMLTQRLYHVGYDPNDSRYSYSGAQDNGVWRVRKNYSANNYGNGYLIGDAMWPIVDQSASNLIYVTGPYGYLSQINSNDNTAIELYQFKTQWDMPFKISYFDKSLFGCNTNLLRSTQVEAGTHWTSVSPPHGGIYAIGISNADPNIWWLGASEGIFLTTNQGASWSPPKRKSLGVSQGEIVTNPHDPNFVLSCGGNGNTRIVELSTDKGGTWTNVAGKDPNALPPFSVNSIAVDSVFPATHWYAATDIGVYYTTDAGNSWYTAGDGIGFNQTRDIQVAPNQTTIRVATFGRSNFEAQISDLYQGKPFNGVNMLTAVKTATNTELRWSANSEAPKTNYRVERSINSQAFKVVGSIAGSGSHHYSYADPVQQPGTYLYRVYAVDQNGTESTSNTVEIHYGDNSFLLYPSFPNPFIADGASGVHIALRYELPQAANVTLEIRGIDGKLVKTIVPGERREASELTEYWNGTDEHGQAVASGTYFFTLTTSTGEHATGKLTLVRK